MLSKFFSKSFKSVLIQASKNKQVFQTGFRSMSTTDVARIEKGKTKLVKAINREIKFEEENYSNDESVSKFLRENGFNLRDDLAENIVELTKKIGNVTVQVVFRSLPPQFEEEAEEGEVEHIPSRIQKSQEGNEEEEFSEKNFADFTVYVIQSNGKAMTFECTSFDSDININFVSIITDVEGHKQLPKLERTSTYAADFSFLEERLQAGFLDYLKGFGINDDVALFIEHYAQDKDQRQYMKWLKDVNEFVERPVE